jgi:hypothetical protein
MRHFYIRAQMGKNAGRKQSKVDADYEKAAHSASLVAPYRHARLSAVKLAGHPVAPELREDASLEELRVEMLKHWKRLVPVLDLEALMAPADGIANRGMPEG